MAWSALEQSLALHFATITMGGKGGADGNTFYIALESFDAVLTTRNKRQIFLTACRRRFEEPLIKQIDKLLEKVERVAARRNRVIHGRWRVSPDYPEALVYEKHIGSGELELYDVPGLQAIHAAIANMQTEVGHFFISAVMPQLGKTSRMDHF